MVDGDVVTTTEDHPFWNATDGEWQGPWDFDEGDAVLTDDGNLLVTGGLVPDSWVTGTAYNLTVDDLHTYFVVVADEGVLVHNCPAGVDLKGLSSKYVKRLLSKLDSEPHAFKEEYVGSQAVSKFDIKMGANGELHLVNSHTDWCICGGLSFMIKVALVVQSPGLTLKQISDAIGRAPDAGYERGEVSPVSGLPRTRTSWSSDLDLAPSLHAGTEGLAAAIESSGTSLALRLAGLAASGCTVVIDVVQELDDTAGSTGLILTPAALRWIADAGATLSVDQYVNR